MFCFSTFQVAFFKTQCEKVNQIFKFFKVLTREKLECYEKVLRKLFLCCHEKEFFLLNSIVMMCTDVLCCYRYSFSDSHAVTGHK